MENRIIANNLNDSVQAILEIPADVKVVYKIV